MREVTTAMSLFVKTCVFAVYSFAVYIFARYLAVSYLISSYSDWLFDHVHEDRRLYDFIVVGAGSAGAILAAGLSDGTNNVLLVEAGSEPPYFSDIPIVAPLLQGSPYDWQYKTVSQDNACKGLMFNQSIWPRGKVLGGSSRLNYMAYVPGNSKDYEDWFPEFADYVFKDDDRIINEPRWQTPLADVILNAILEIAPNTKNDFHRVRLTMQDGERWSTDRVLENASRRGLHIITHGIVNKLIFDGNTARGIEYFKWGCKYKVFARNGVIVSAGAIGSPKLLMLSGIGPKEHLEELRINVINDLPVGENLVDHILTGLDLVTLDTSASLLNMDDVLNPMSALNYSMYGQGPWTFPGIEAVGTFHTLRQNVENESPDLQIMVIPTGISQDNGIVLGKAMGISDETFQQYFEPLAFRTAITIAPVLLHPKSSGKVKLASSNPFDDPIIDPKYLSHQDDVSTLINGIQFVKRLIQSKSMRKIGASLYEATFPGCENFLFDSTEYWECYVRHLTLTSYHPAGTCGIGRVVDQSFRVLNMKNLYVVDASVLPQLPSGNINAAVMMLAKRAIPILNHYNVQKPMSFTKKTCAKMAYYSMVPHGTVFQHVRDESEARSVHSNT